MAELIKSRREELGMTQAQLAAKIGYKYGNFISMLESQNAEFPLDKWSRFADALELSRPFFLQKCFEAAYPEMLMYIGSFRDPDRAPENV